ncbi:double-strand break repair helicase AddA [Mesorhizobium xinjiangense]|uniref:double-strand break repair helicase AddA n=1 Tax=Mesorhizobium xinjiangense TaxID=2678685 RepID=UPI0012ED32D4|nr:double-strand break repair helicase AddA [Mesorhizobium xinjiangense]
MSAPRFIPAETLERQARAADPASSAWVSANAGSGKTHVLSQRVIRLLLEGTDPARILCLTYTKAAAANMATRVFRELSRWARLGNDELANEIALLEGRKPDGARLRLARQLFARALETPGGLKIQTIHAFCEAVLHRFPLEANIAGHFEMLDQQMEQALVAEARRDLLAGVVGGMDAELGAAFATVLEAGGEWGLNDLLDEIVAKRDPVRAFIDGMGREPLAVLREEFGFGDDETADTITGEAWPLPGFSPAQFDELAALAESTGAGRVCDRLLPNARLAFAEADPQRRLRLLGRAFLKDKGEPYKPSWLFTNGLRKVLPDINERYDAAVGRLQAAGDRMALYRMIEGTAAALTIADWLIARYERLKSARGFLDFNDLISRTAALLSRGDVGAWVHYKMDQGIDHILVDEAQDTSPEQWRVVAKLAEEFFSGAGSRGNVNRTVFAVGDEKQSIYSFQGAEPEAFDINGRMFAEKLAGAGRRFERVQLTHSFRSTEDVLQAVDTVFAAEPARQGLTRNADVLEHKAVRIGEPGLVEVWQQIAPEQVDEPDDWTVPIDHASAPAARLAELVARTIRHWLASGEAIEARGRAMRPGDILVLVRKRDSFIHALSRSLKNMQIAVAGADRLNLRSHIAVKDMIALGHVLMQPHDDLSLAAVLKSPVFGLTEDDLYALAHDRPRTASLHERLMAKAEEDARFRLPAEDLVRWRREAEALSVFEFYGALLGRDGLRRRMVQRLGHEAGEILDEFLNFALAVEKTGLPGLESFLATIESAGPEIKREMDQTRDEVRIMTVHASKGLEAPVVLLVDNGSRPFSESHLPRLVPFRSRNTRWPGEGFVWRMPGAPSNAWLQKATATIGEKAREEYRRLLYVGMTRAEDRLVVCGYRGKTTPDPGIWHALVHQAMAGGGAEETRHPLTELAVHRFRLPDRRTAAPAEPTGHEAPPAPVFPQHLRRPLPAEAHLPRPLSPSGAAALLDDHREPVIATRSPVLDAAGGPAPAIARGITIHRLLQSLPDLPAVDREAAAMRYLDRTMQDWPHDDRLEAWRQVERILMDEAFGAVFGKGSRAEVAVMGKLVVGGRERAVSGKIDRLAVDADSVTIVDYKTNRPPPRTLVEVPLSYVTQLALYRALLAPLYPEKNIRTALLFTEAPSLFTMPDKVLDDALAQLDQA